MKIEVVEEYNNCPPYEEDRLEIVSGNFVEGEYVTVVINYKVAKRKVRFSRDAGDLYVTVNNMRYFYSEFCK